MKLEAALKKPRTVPELVKLTKLSRGGVLAGLKRLKAKKAGTKRNARGPKSTLYVARPKFKTKTLANSPAERFEQVKDMLDQNQINPTQAAALLEATKTTDELVEETIAAAVIGQDPVTQANAEEQAFEARERAEMNGTNE